MKLLLSTRLWRALARPPAPGGLAEGRRAAAAWRRAGSATHRRPPWRCSLLMGMVAAGCSGFRYENSSSVFDRPPRMSNDSLAGIWLKTGYLYPARDYLLWTWLGRGLLGDESWNVAPDGGVADGPFFENRAIAAVDARTLENGPAEVAPPHGPWRITGEKSQGATAGCVAQDADGRTFFLKLDHPEYPALGTSAELIGARLTWLLGYRVPACFLVMIDGTGDVRFDGRRATASLTVPGRILGTSHFDHFRMRREVRALRLVAAWINDTDRTDNNMLVTVVEGRAYGYQVDFNSSLGSWNGRPKEAWRGRRYAWDVEHQWLGLATLGLLPRIPAATEVLSPAIGRYDDLAGQDPRRWRSQNPNTAFDRMTAADAGWIAGRMAAVSVEQLGAIVAGAKYPRQEDAEATVQRLIERRRRILEAWGASSLLAARPAGYNRTSHGGRRGRGDRGAAIHG